MLRVVKALRYMANCLGSLELAGVVTYTMLHDAPMPHADRGETRKFQVYVTDFARV